MVETNREQHITSNFHHFVRQLFIYFRRHKHDTIKHQNQMIRISSLFLTLLLFQSISAQIVVDPTVSAQNAVNNILLGSGVEALNITFSGDTNQIGSFLSNGSNMPINSGVIMGTGNVNFASSPDPAGLDPNAPGSGGNSGGGGSLGGGNHTAGDSDLELISGLDMNDAAILEFDFVATGDTVSFNFVFASEEYPDFVCSDVNDAFGFFLSGPGIVGGQGFVNDAVNLALIPGTDTPVTINSLNNGVSATGDNGPCDLIDPNWQDYSVYYIANHDISTDPNVIEYDGFTVVLTATSEVDCGETYHIKMAIADGGDGDTVYDSAVFLQAGSFDSNAISVIGTAAISGGLVFAGDSVVVEGCNNAAFQFIRPDSTMADTIRFEINGIAENGVDYTLIPDSVIFTVGQTEASIPFDAIDDGIAEPFESIIIRYEYINSCMNLDTVETVLYVADPVVPTVSMENDTIICPGSFVTLFPQTTGFGGFTYLWDDPDASTSTTLTVSPTEATTYNVTATDICGVPVQTSADVVVQEWPDLVITPITGTSDCPGGDIEIGVTVEGGSPGYTFFWFDPFSQNSTVTVNPLETQTFTVSVNDQCEFQNIDIEVVVDWPGLDIVPTGGVSGCPGDPIDVSVAVTGGFPDPDYTYEWQGSSSTSSNATVNPTSTGFVTVTVADGCSSQDAQVPVDVAVLDDIDLIYDSLLCVQDPFTITNIIGGTGVYFFNTSETPDTLSITSLGTYTGLIPGFYQIVISDECTAVSPTILGIEIEVCDTFIPNVFSPDSDGATGSSIGGSGLNERFYIDGISSFPESKLTVFNRWGTIVYEDNDYRNTWTGKSGTSGNDLKDGTYFYILNRSDGKNINGSITLLRK